MKIPVQIHFLHMEPSEAVETAVREKLAKLERLSADLMSCRVTIDLGQKHQHQGRPFSVRIDLTRPGRDFVVDRVVNEDVYVALRDAFDDLKRQLEETIGRQHDREQGRA